MVLTRKQSKRDSGGKGGWRRGKGEVNQKKRLNGKKSKGRGREKSLIEMQKKGD